jgi:pimeloyl-ACP methyl ester carboxylesterase
MTFSIRRYGAFLVCFVLLSCSDTEPDECTLTDSVEGLSVEGTHVAGIHAVGRRELVFSREGLCWSGSENLPCTRELHALLHYPAEFDGPDAPVAESGPFPLLVYNHGFTSSKNENQDLRTLVASRGFVVIGASFPLTSIGASSLLPDVVNQPGDVSYMIDVLLDVREDEPSPLPGAIDASRIAVGGLSLGGMTTLLVSFHGLLRDARVRAAFALASPTAMFMPSFYETVDIPLLLVSGTADAVIRHEDNAQYTMQDLRSPAALVSFELGGHFGFTPSGSAFEYLDHMDSVGCAALVSILGEGPAFAALDGLGGAEHGVNLESEGPPPCTLDPWPRSMRPSRQYELTVATVVAFLETTLHDDERYAAFLAEGIEGNGCDARYLAR